MIIIELVEIIYIYINEIDVDQPLFWHDLDRKISTKIIVDDYAIWPTN